MLKRKTRNNVELPCLKSSPSPISSCTVVAQVEIGWTMLMTTGARQIAEHLTTLSDRKWQYESFEACERHVIGAYGIAARRGSID